MNQNIFRWLIIFAMSLCMIAGAHAQNIVGVSSITTLKNLGAAAPLYTNVYVAAYHAGVNDGGGGNFVYEGVCDQVSPDEGTHYAIVGGAPAGSCYARKIAPNEPWSVQWWGAYGNEQELQNCSISSSSAVVACTAHTFATADLSKVAGFYLAGGSNSGQRASTLLTTTSSLSGANIVLGTNASNTVSSGGIFAWGTDDKTAINTACAATPPGRVLMFPQPGYLLSDTFLYGNGTATTCHDLLFPGHQLIVFAIANHTDAGVDRHAAPGWNTGFGYYPMTIRGAVTFDCLNTGLDCFRTLGGKNLYWENVSILRSYRNGEAFQTADPDYVQQVVEVNTFIAASGLNCISAWAGAVSPSQGGFIDEIDHDGLECAGWSYNGTGLGASGTGLGAGVFAINTATGTDNFIQGWSFKGAQEFENGRTVAISYGSDVNANAIVWADGNIAHAIYNPSPVSTMAAAVQRWTFSNPPQIEGNGSTLSGSVFFAESTRIAVSQMGILYKVGGAYTTVVNANIAFGSDCSVGCGNTLVASGISGNVSAASIGAPLTIPALNLASLAVSATAPTILSGFGTTPAISDINGTLFFVITVGSGGTASTGSIGLPTAAHGWNCYANDVTGTSSSVFVTKMTASNTASATLTNFNTSGAATAWAAADGILVSCMGG